MPPYRRLLTYSAALFAIGCVVTIVWLANQGLAARYFGFLYAFPGGDKVGHFAIMGTLTVVVTLAFGRSARLAGRQFPIAPLVILAAITLEELSQALVPARSLSLSDWLANLAGITMGGALAWRFLRRARLTDGYSATE